MGEWAGCIVAILLIIILAQLIVCGGLVREAKDTEKELALCHKLITNLTSDIVNMTIEMEGMAQEISDRSLN